jgi:ferredoxin
MKIIVDRERCDGNGVCMGIAPEVFDVDDDLHLHVAQYIPGEPELRARIRQAVTSCPVLALRLVEE